jgi:hypothetical protein
MSGLLSLHQPIDIFQQRLSFMGDILFQAAGGEQGAGSKPETLALLRLLNGLSIEV